MIMKKKVMILGASYSQIPLFEAAGRMGIHTVAASIPGPYAGFAYADEVCYVDISDPQAVTEAAKKFDIDGIATCSLDLGMRAIGAVCEELKLPGPGKDAAIRASNKWEMKKALVKAGVQTAAFYRVSNEKELEEVLEKLTFPVIVKAVDLMGSRGIYRSGTPDEARENYKKTMEATGKDYCLVEEFIRGEIFGVEALVQNGQIIYMLPNNIEAFQGDTPSPVGHSVPFREMDRLGEQAMQQTELAIRALGLDNCPVNCDMIKSGDKVYVIELTGRSGATGIAEMVGIYYQLNYYEIILRTALGMDVSSYFPGEWKGTPNLTHTLMADREGTVRKIINRNPQAPDLLELSFNIEPGDRVHPYRNGRDRIGQVILKGDTLKECEQRLEEILSGIHLELEEDSCREQPEAE